MQQLLVCEQAFYSPELVVEVLIRKLAIERKRLAEGDCEIIAVSIKMYRGKKQLKFKKVKVEEGEGILQNWIDEKCVALINLHGEMEYEFNKNTKQGNFFILLGSLTLFSRNL